MMGWVRSHHTFLTAWLKHRIGKNRKLGAVFEIEAVKQVSDVGFHRAFGNVELFGNFSIGGSGGN
jgi:hypothetical protein